MEKRTKAAQRIIGQEANIRALEVAIERNIPVLLVGETGTGKTSLLRELADKHQKVLHRVNLNGESTPDEIIGKWIVKGGDLVWINGLLLQAMMNGDWIVLDEVNAALPEILFALHSLLDDDAFVCLTDKDGEVVRPSEGFRIFACMNPSAEYVGTKELNKAFMSRWRMRLQFGYLDPRKEASVLRKRTGVDSITARQIAGFAQEVRKAKAEDKVFTTVSHRDTIAWASLVDAFGIEDAFRYTVRDLFTQEEHDVVQEAWANNVSCVSRTLASTKEQYPEVESIGDLMRKLRSERLRLGELQQDLSTKSGDIVRSSRLIEERNQELEAESRRLKLERKYARVMLEEVRQQRIELSCDYEDYRQKMVRLREQLMSHPIGR